MDCPIGKRAWQWDRVESQITIGKQESWQVESDYHRVGIQLGNQAALLKEKEAKRKSARPKGLAWDTSLFLRFAQS